MTGAEPAGQSGAFYEWLLSDHPAARAERTRRREAYHRDQLERAGANPDLPESKRRLAGSMGPLAERTRAEAEAALAEPDEAYVTRERGIWETFRRASADGYGSPGYRYPARYIGAAAASQPQPGIEPEPEAEPHSAAPPWPASAQARAEAEIDGIGRYEPGECGQAEDPEAAG